MNHPFQVKFRNEILTDHKKIANAFNTHFTSLSSEKIVSDVDCKRFTFDIEKLK